MTETQAREPVRFDRSRLRLGIVVAVICAALAFVVLKGLGDATTFFVNADEAVAERDEFGERRFRLQGTVVPDSINTSGETVSFRVGYRCSEVDVRHEGVRPELFRPGIPVVLEGAYAAGSDTFASDRIVVRHTEEYRAEEADRLTLADREICLS